MTQFDRSPLRKRLKELANGYWWLLRHARRPESIRTVLAIIVVCHSVRFAWLFRDFGLEAAFLVWYFLCRSVHAADLSPTWRRVKHFALPSANFLFGLQLTRDYHLENLLPGVIEPDLRRALVALLICFILFTVEAFAEAYELFHARHYLLDRGTLLGSVERDFHFYNPVAQDVLILVSAATSGTEHSSFVVALCTINGEILRSFLARGYLASSELYLSSGHYVLDVRNTSRSFRPVHINVSVSVDVPKDRNCHPSSDSSVHDTFNFTALQELPTTAAETTAPHLCPTGARAEHHPREDEPNCLSGVDPAEETISPLVLSPRRHLTDRTDDNTGEVS